MLLPKEQGRLARQWRVTSLPDLQTMEIMEGSGINRRAGRLTPQAGHSVCCNYQDVCNARSL